LTTIDPPAPSPWTERLRRAHASFPATATEITRDATARIVNGEEVLSRVLRDILAVDNVAVRRGDRPLPDVDEGRRLLHELRGQDYTNEPFHVAFRILAGTRSLTNLERRTGMSRATLSRLLNNRKPPRPDEIEAVAAAFSKRPTYFAEYRTSMFAALVWDHLSSDPDRSAVLAHQLGLGR